MLYYHSRCPYPPRSDIITIPYCFIFFWFSGCLGVVVGSYQGVRKVQEQAFMDDG